MVHLTESDEDVYVPKKRKAADSEMDITPMIDVTFQLLIFFMVTSTMQGNPPADVPPAMSGGSIEVAKLINVVVKPAAVPGNPPEIEFEEQKITQDDLKARLEERASSSPNGIHVMILADRTMTNGDMNEVELLISEIPNVTYHFGVQDRRQ
jgi:biopolymer transport protein ExbD